MSDPLSTLNQDETDEIRRLFLAWRAAVKRKMYAEADKLREEYRQWDETLQTDGAFHPVLEHPDHRKKRSDKRKEGMSTITIKQASGRIKAQFIPLKTFNKTVNGMENTYVLGHTYNLRDNMHDLEQQLPSWKEEKLIIIRGL